MEKRDIFKYYIINKPFKVLSQFTSEEGKTCLKDIFTVPKDVYSIGRLDFDSEGLLILTNDNYLKTQLANPKYNAQKIYYVQVENVPTKEDLKKLENGIILNINGKEYKTQKCKINLLSESKYSKIEERNPPIRFRKSIPTTWLEIHLNEGKNRQIRKMTATIGCPTLRIVRFAIGEINLKMIEEESNIKEFNRSEIYQIIGINKNNKDAKDAYSVNKKQKENTLYHNRLKEKREKYAKSLEEKPKIVEKIEIAYKTKEVEKKKSTRFSGNKSTKSNTKSKSPTTKKKYISKK